MIARIPFPIRQLTLLVTVITLAACGESPHMTEPAVAPVMAKVNDNNGMQVLSIAFVDDRTCSFPFAISIEGFVKVASVQVKKDGSVRIVEVAPATTVTAAAGSKSLRGAIGGTAIYDVNPQGDLVKITFPGLNAAFTVPGTGIVLLETGLLVLAPDGTVLRESGPHQMFGSNPDVVKFCAALTP